MPDQVRSESKFARVYLIAVPAIALLIAALVVRSSVVAAYAELRPDLAARFWAGHPQVEDSLAMLQIARSARKGEQPDAPTFDMLNDAARKSPLLADPFLVRGLRARVEGHETLAAKAIQAAELRDGRSAPARYFLADHYVRSGEVTRGLREIAMLARMFPGGVAALSPYVATFARDPRNWRELKALFRSEPSLEDASLTSLAADPRNADVILRLAAPRPANQIPPWAPSLLSGLVKAGYYEKAYQIWRSVGHIAAAPGALIYDAAFKDATAPGPFNWTLTTSSLGYAEREPGGRLHVAYYGEDNGEIAWQLLLLKPGRYRLRMRISGHDTNDGSLRWTLSCENSSVQLLDLPIAANLERSFVVPNNCPAQRLQLAGLSPEMPRAVDITVSDLSLVAEQSGG